MQFYSENLTGRAGSVLTPLAGVEVRVVDGNGVPVPLWMDEAGSTPLLQPLVTDSTGYFGFHAADGSYVLKFTGSQIAPFERHIHLLDQASIEAAAAQSIATMGNLATQAATSAANAAGSASAATGSASSAASDANAAAVSAGNAAGSATSAATSAVIASNASTSALSAASAATEANTAAIVARDAAQAARTGAESARDAAYGHVVTAAGSATAAGSSASAAASSASAAADKLNQITFSKASLDAAVQTAQLQAQASLVNANNVAGANAAAQGYKDQAASSAVQALIARDAAITASQVATAATENLAAYAQSTHVGNVVATCLIDTSRDSDGGAYRKRLMHTSWYNETICTGAWRGQLANLTAAWNVVGAASGDFYQNTTDGKFYMIGGTKAAPTQTEVFRGNKRDFPALAAVIAESGRVVVYDLTQPGAPMWMVFKVGTNNSWLRVGNVSSVAYVNGILLAGGSSGSAEINLITEVARFRTTALFQARGNASQRNAELGYDLVSNSGGLTNVSVNSIACTVLPDAPVDPASGIQVPTVAVGTAGGVSIIKHDGTVVSNTYGAYNIGAVVFADNVLYGVRNGSVGRIIRYGRVQDMVTGTAVDYEKNSSTVPPIKDGSAFKLATMGRSMFALGGVSVNPSLQLYRDNPASNTKGMVAEITTSYNTGWMVGDVRGCWLADTVAETVAGSGELVTNGTFATDISGWTDGSTAPATISWDSGTQSMLLSGSSGAARGQQAQATVAGRTYLVTVTVAVSGATPTLAVGTTAGGSNLLGSQSMASSGTYTFSFVATGTTSWLNFGAPVTGTNTARIDNVSCKLAEPDRSVKNKGGIINGSLIKAPVATGAQLVGYSGWGASNYIEFPYDANLDYASGTFAWVLCLKEGANVATEVLFERAYYTAGAYSGATIRCVVDSVGKLRVTYSDGVNAITQTSTSAINNTGWQVGIVLGFDGTNFRMMQNGVDIATPIARGAVGSLSNANAVLRIGLDVSGASPATNATLALLHSGATFPSSDQSGTIYRDELQLFQPGAQCTLDGTSNAVTALAYDDLTDVLHVGTSWGRTALKGLVRVESAATSVGAITALAAGMGAHVSSGASGSRYVQPALSLREELRARYEARQAMAREEIPLDFDGIASQTAFTLPLGFKAKDVFVAGTKKRNGSTKDFTLSFDGYRETVNFGVSPGATWVQITANRSA